MGKKGGRDGGGGRLVPFMVVSTGVVIEVVDNSPLVVTSDCVDEIEVCSIVTVVLGISARNI